MMLLKKLHEDLFQCVFGEGGGGLCAVVVNHRQHLGPVQGLGFQGAPPTNAPCRCSSGQGTLFSFHSIPVPQLSMIVDNPDPIGKVPRESKIYIDYALCIFFCLNWKISKIFPKNLKFKILERQRKILNTPMVLHLATTKWPQTITLDNLHFQV